MRVDSDILFYAFRYALGRMTYAVSTVAESIIKNWDELDVNRQSLIHKEIQEAFDNNNYGMEMDKNTWQKVLNLKVKTNE